VVHLKHWSGREPRERGERGGEKMRVPQNVPFTRKLMFERGGGPAGAYPGKSMGAGESDLICKKKARSTHRLKKEVRNLVSSLLKRLGGDKVVPN